MANKIFPLLALASTFLISCSYRNSQRKQPENLNKSEIENFIRQYVISHNFKAGAYFCRKATNHVKNDSLWIFDMMYFFKDDSVELLKIRSNMGNFQVINSRFIPFKYDSAALLNPIIKNEFNPKTDSVRLASPPWNNDPTYFVLLTPYSINSTTFTWYQCLPNVSKPHPLCVLYNLSP